MHDHDHDYGIRERAARIRAALDREATKLEECRRRCAELEAARRARSACLARLCGHAGSDPACSLTPAAQA